ncbi:MAG: hypothetical protein RL701_5428 [Pseudomonadota bacterium]|jgi:glycosyltransferase involved in cell wall biosynthesis
MEKLWVVMPAYNEQECIPAVIEEWLPALRAVAESFTFCVIDDGSKDHTLRIVNELAERHPELHVLSKGNSGHGQTCVFGYHYAATHGADWILQIDSDGQCDPRFFAELWRSRQGVDAVYGYRVSRDDGTARVAISRVVSLVTWLGTGTWVRDANVPYRLMRSGAILGILAWVPRDIHLANVLVSALQVKHQPVRWIDIHFRQRRGGVASVASYAFVKHGVKLLAQLWKAKAATTLTTNARPPIASATSGRERSSPQHSVL